MKSAVLVLATAGCLEAGSVVCKDGRTCPAGTVCVEAPPRCATPTQLVVCGHQGIADGYPCKAGDLRGICEASVCLPGCGDGAVSGSEECDDGNFASHDGCSSRCLVETPAWHRFEDAWTPLAEYAAAHHAGDKAVYVVGGVSPSSLRADQWRYAGGGVNNWIRTSPTAATLPPARQGAMMAYDSNRNVLVLFGGSANDVLDDTWEYDGMWVKKAPVSSPPARSHGALVFDSANNRIVLFGGGSDVVHGDTWIYDGTTWTQLSPPLFPAPRKQHAMTWDPARNRAVLVGGVDASGPNLGDTWEYANGTWTEVMTQSPMGRRFSAALEFDPTSGRVVLFGGITDGQIAMNDTWLYDGVGWTQLVTGLAPPPRRNARLVHSGADQSLLLIGGASSPLLDPLLLDDVWALNNGTWTERSPRFQPRPRYGAPAVYDERHAELYVSSGANGTHDAWIFSAAHWSEISPQVPQPFRRREYAAAYDPTRGVILMFGGATGTGKANVTLEYRRDGDERTWSVPSIGSAPPARTMGALAYDGRTMVLFGGEDVNNEPLGDTWEYDGTAWHPIAPGIAPAPSRGAAIAFDPVRARLVLFDRAGETWTYAARSWSPLPLAPGPRPRPRDLGAMTFDWQTGRMLLVGGVDENRDFVTDVWELAGDTWTRSFVQGDSPPRVRFGLGSHRAFRQTILFGGLSAGGASGETWLFQYRSSTPEELCDGVADDDGDRHPDEDDPDCTGR